MSPSTLDTDRPPWRRGSPTDGGVFCWIAGLLELVHKFDLTNFRSQARLTSGEFLNQETWRLSLAGKKSLARGWEGRAQKLNRKLPCGKSCGTYGKLTGPRLDSLGSCQEAVSLSWPRGSRLGYPRNLLGEIHRGDEHTPQKQDQKAHRSQEERPVCPPGSLGALYWQSLTLRQLARERCFIITSREWRGDLGLKGNKFTNATAGNNCTWGGKLVYQAQM